VIESCSGLRGIEVLTIVALAIRELFSASGTRSWSVVAIAPTLGFALNVLRIAVVIATTESAGSEANLEETWDHTPQGVVVLAVGTALLYLLAHRLASRAGAAAPIDAQRADEADLLVGYEDAENVASRLLSPKLLVPDYDRSLVDSGPARLWLLGLDARSAIATRDTEFLYSYLWRLRDEGALEGDVEGGIGARRGAPAARTAARGAAALDAPRARRARGARPREAGPRSLHRRFPRRARAALKRQPWKGPLPICSRIGTKAGINIERRCQFAPSTTIVWPVT
jgi:exosortase/archaeosortase family protein